MRRVETVLHVQILPALQILIGLEKTEMGKSSGGT